MNSKTVVRAPTFSIKIHARQYEKQADNGGQCQTKR